MEILIWIVLIVLLFGVGILSTRLWCYDRQMNHILKELELLQGEDTNRRLTSCVNVGKTDKVIIAMNHIISQRQKRVIALKKDNIIYRESITSISHDIRTPLTSAKGYLQMLQKGSLSEEKQAEYLNIVERRVDNVADMLNQLFEFARIEAGELCVEPESLNIGNLFAETISLFYEDFVEKGFEPKVTIIQSPCHIWADRHAFIRIVENLIKNALVHGTGHFEMSLIEEEKSAVIRVANTTNTIELKEIDRIFDRFYTTDQSRNQKTTGLGLAIVKRFAEQMGGSAEASLEDQRFMVTIRIPLYIC